MRTITHNGDTFQIVDHVPLGYQIWNIGEHMLDGFLPFCRKAAHQPFPGGQCIESDTLKALPCKHAQVILKAIRGGCNTVEKMEQYVCQNKDAKEGTYAHAAVQRCLAALPYMRELNWG